MSFIDVNSCDYDPYQTVSEARSDAQEKGIEIHLCRRCDVDLNAYRPYHYATRWEISPEGEVEVIEW